MGICQSQIQHFLIKAVSSEHMECDYGMCFTLSNFRASKLVCAFARSPSLFPAPGDTPVGALVTIVNCDPRCLLPIAISEAPPPYIAMLAFAQDRIFGSKHADKFIR
jgi:hypothetical protein